jgi:Outer membrane lipoprotein-sorting protein
MKPAFDSSRFRLALPFAFSLFLGVAAAAAQQPGQSVLKNSVPEGEKLRAELLAQRPVESSTVKAMLKSRRDDGERREIPVLLRTELDGADAWRAIYATAPAQGAPERLVIVHRAGAPNEYRFRRGSAPEAPLHGTAIFSPFAGSDFSAADLGLEFLHWPGQKLVMGEMRMGRWCHVLESTHPQPPPGAYARVMSWVDRETGGLIRAEAFDTRGRTVKEFSLRNFKKVDGRWQLKEMEIINLASDTRTRLEFDLTFDAGDTGAPPP